MEKHNGNEIREALRPWQQGRPRRSLAFKHGCSLIVLEGNDRSWGWICHFCEILESTLLCNSSASKGYTAMKKVGPQKPWTDGYWCCCSLPSVLCLCGCRNQRREPAMAAHWMRNQPDVNVTIHFIQLRSYFCAFMTCLCAYKYVCK